MEHTRTVAALAAVGGLSGLVALAVFVASPYSLFTPVWEMDAAWQVPYQLFMLIASMTGIFALGIVAAELSVLDGVEEWLAEHEQEMRADVIRMRRAVARKINVEEARTDTEER